MRASVDADSATESIRLLIDGPVAFVAEMGLKAGRGEHRAAHAKLFYRAPQLFDRGLRLLKGDQRHSPKAGVFLEISLMEPVVVRAGAIYGPIAAHALAEGGPAGRTEPPRLNADIF